MIKIRDASGAVLTLPTLKGVNGKSAYQYAVEAGFIGTEAEFTELIATTTATVKTHLNDTTAHSDIRESVQNVTDRLNALVNSDDETLDSLSEIVEYIQSNKELIDSITVSKVNVSDIIDNLTTNASDKPLSANQGLVIKELIDALEEAVSVKVETDGSNATGEWNIDITGNAATATNADSATTAAKLETSAAGNGTQPVYFKDGIPVAIDYTVEKSVPSDAVFTDTVYEHPTESGYNHIPSGGSDGQVLKWKEDGSAEWGDIVADAAAKDGDGNVITDTYATKTDMEGVLKANLSSYMVTEVDGSYGDFNDYLNPGIYTFNMSAYMKITSNVPTEQAGALIVTDYTGNSNSIYTVGACRIQEYNTYNNTGTYKRYIYLYTSNASSGGTSTLVFGDWKQIAFITDNVTSATKATQDGGGNVITDTYATLDDIEGVLKANLSSYVVTEVDESYGDFNDYLDPGIYAFSKSAYMKNTLNIPTEQAGALIVTDYTGVTKDMTEAYAYRVQEFHTYDNSGVYKRSIQSDGLAVFTIGDWVKTMDANSMADYALKSTMIPYNTVSKDITLSGAGWYRIAKFEHAYASAVNGSSCNSCDLILKRSWGNTNNEYCEIKLMSVYGQSTIFSGACKSNQQLFTKVRHTLSSGPTVSYIEVYYNSSVANTTRVILNNAVASVGKWVLMEPEATEETVDSYTVRSSGDIITNSRGTATCDSAGNKIVDTYLPLAGGSMTGNLLPATNAMYTLGNSSYKWSNVWAGTVSGSSYYVNGGVYQALAYVTSSQIIYKSTDSSASSTSTIMIGTTTPSTKILGNYIYFQPSTSVSSSSTIHTASDEKVKTFTDDIENDEEKLIKLFDMIRPKSYNYKYLKSDSLDIGFSAQDIEKAMIELGLDPEKYGILNIKYNHMLSRGDDLEDSKYYTKFYEVSYNDLFSLSLLKMNVMEKQHIARLDLLEERLTVLENK